MLFQLKKYVLSHEDWLMEKILSYAKQRDYTKYTSTLKEAWRLSISGLSKSLIDALDAKGTDLELGPHVDYVSDPASQFGILEAERHRQRGVSLEMFLGLMKYYRQSYSDLIRESDFQDDTKIQYEQIIKRFFDRVEIGFCTKWSSAEDQEIVGELQSSNRQMTNEKNKYLTIFESLSMPVFVVDLEGNIENMNHAASEMLDYSQVPGKTYYNKEDTKVLRFVETFAWLKKSFNLFIKGAKKKEELEITIRNKGQFFFVSFSRSLDISGKFINTIVIIEDITKRKTME
jgi:PAS domain S-box-containing protein